MKIETVQLNWEPLKRKKLEEVYGNECAKRALEVALVGGHCVVFLGSVNSPAQALAFIGARIAKDHNLPYKAYVAPICLCGAYGHPKVECCCSPNEIYEHASLMREKIGDAVMFIETASPRPSDLKYQGEFEEAFAVRVIASKGFRPIPEKLGQDAEDILKMAAGVYQFDYDKAIAVAKTIAQMGNSEIVGANHMAEAIQYIRNPFRDVDSFEEVKV